MTDGLQIASLRSVNTQVLIQLAGSAAAISLIILLTAWATRGRGAPGLDEAGARRQFGVEFPDMPIEALWLAGDGRGAVARSGERALVLARMGDGYWARQLPWSAAAAVHAEGGKLSLPLREPGAPRAVLAFDVWPPEGVRA